MKNMVFKTAILSIFFLILSEKISFVNIFVAIMISLLVVKINTGHKQVASYINRKTIIKWFVFITYIFFEVVKANFQVAKIALSINMSIDPQIVFFESKINDYILLTILANVITLTPGTMTMDITENKLKIHCLNQSYANGLNNMALENLLYKIEGDLIG